VWCKAFSLYRSSKILSLLAVLSRATLINRLHLMLRLFRRKIILISSKIFFSVWFTRKNYEMQKWEFCKYRQNPATSGRRCRIPTRKIDLIRPDYSRNLPNPAGCCRTPVLIGFQQLTIAKFWRSNIKRACKDEEFNFGKRLMILKIVNRFSKIK
jgi:hypothetical protein